MLKSGRTENLLDVLMKYSIFINCRLTNEITIDEIAHKVRVYTAELSKRYEKRNIFVFNPISRQHFPNK